MRRRKKETKKKKRRRSRVSLNPDRKGMDGGLVVVVVVVVGCLPFRTEDEKGHGVTVEARMKIVWTGWREWGGQKKNTK